MSALQNQTSLNQNTFFFATKEEGEQDLFVSTITAAPFTDFYVGITGAGGNQVQINQMPDVIGTSTAGGEEMLYAGTASTYKTLSTLSATAVGTSISIDRAPASGITTIEAYAGNGSFGGFEFLSRGVNSALLSTPLNTYMSSIGRPGATAVLGASGTLVAGAALITPVATSLSLPDVTGAGTGCFAINDLSGAASLGRWSWYKYGNPIGGDSGTNLALGAYNDAGTFIAAPITIGRKTASVLTVNQYAYPEALITVSSIAASSTVTLSNATPAVLLSLSNVPFTASNYYLTDVNVQISVSNPGSNEAYLDFGVRLGGNGSFSYGNTIYVPPSGIPFNVQTSLNQITDAGSSAPGVVDIIGYQQNAASGSLDVTATTVSGGASHQFKNIT
jgi:hypothetical protein